MRGVDIVYHAGAMKHVGFCEENPIDAVKTNVLGTQNLITVAIEEKCSHFVNISTDKATNPLNVMGATKLLSERLVASASNYKGRIPLVFLSVRFGNVLKSNGSVYNVFKNQIDNKKDLTLTNGDMTRFIMKVEDAVRLVVESSMIAVGDEIFILKMPCVQMNDFADAMIKKFKSKVKIQIVGEGSAEKIHEILINEEEIYYAYEKDDLIVVTRKHGGHYKELGFSKLFYDVNSYFSKKLSVEEIMELIS